MFPVLSWASDINHTSGQISRESNGNRLRPTFKCGEGAITIDTHPSLLFWRNFRIKPTWRISIPDFPFSQGAAQSECQVGLQNEFGNLLFWFLKTVFYVIFFRSLPPRLAFFIYGYACIFLLLVWRMNKIWGFIFIGKNCFKDEFLDEMDFRDACQINKQFQKNDICL